MRRVGILVGFVSGVCLLAGCGAGEGTVRAEVVLAGDAAAASSLDSPVEVVIGPADGSADVRLDQVVTVRAYRGKLTEVTVVDDGGAPVPGERADDRLTWTATAALAPSRSYTVPARAVDLKGREVVSSSGFTTLTPRAVASATVLPGEGWTVGVGMPVIVDFSAPVSDRSAAVAALTVRTTPELTGAWRWFSSRQVQWRPEEYWPSGATVEVTADLRGLEVAPGVWGTGRTVRRFSVGDEMISTVDVRRHTMTVRRNGEVIRRIPITTGKRGFETRDGVKVVMSRESRHRMDARTTGIDRDDPEYYNVVARYAMRLTGTGEFIHAAPWSVASHGRANVSHGCTGMSLAHARWLFDRSRVGDVVEFVGSGRPLEWGNGYTAWNMSFRRWSQAG